MVADIRVREEVGRVTACPEQSRMGARRRPNANKPSPLATFVRRAADCPPYQSFNDLTKLRLLCLGNTR